MSAEPKDTLPQSAKIGVLAVQGDFAEHAARLRVLGCETTELRCVADLDTALDAIVLPGGESTVQAALLEEFAMAGPLKRMIETGTPVLATCAGLILLAREVEHANGRSDSSAPFERAGWASGALGTLPVQARRNAYGRQLASFHAEAPLRFNKESTDETPNIPLTFIRAPQIVATGEGVETLVSMDETPVAVRFGNQLGITFHPELDQDDTLYRYFLSFIEDKQG